MLLNDVGIRVKTLKGLKFVADSQSLRKLIEGHFLLNEKISVHFFGLHGFSLLRRDPQLLKILTARSSYLVCDSTFCWLVCLIAGRRVQRIPGPDFFSELFLNNKFWLGRPHYFYGDTPDTLLQLVRRYTGDCSLTTVPQSLGSSPPFQSPESITLENFSDLEVKREDPVVWVGLGCPKQDKVCDRIKNETGISTCVAVGAAFRFEAGMLRRAHPICRSLGFEWIWRLVQEPAKTASRLMGVFSALVFLAGSDSTKRINSA